jgi:hypothetical protein
MTFLNYLYGAVAECCNMPHVCENYICLSRNYILLSVNHTLRVGVTQSLTYASVNHTRAGQNYTLHVEMILSV